MSWKNFLLGESKQKVALGSYIQSLEELFRALRPSTLREKRILEVGLSHLREMASGIRKLVDENEQLKESARLIEEERDKFKKRYILLKIEKKKNHE
jgi:hypothetical protein